MKHACTGSDCEETKGVGRIGVSLGKDTFRQTMMVYFRVTTVGDNGRAVHERIGRRRCVAYKLYTEVVYKR